MIRNDEIKPILIGNKKIMGTAETDTTIDMVFVPHRNVFCIGVNLKNYETVSDMLDFCPTDIKVFTIKETILAVEYFNHI